jgi:hypothetical protein
VNVPKKIQAAEEDSVCALVCLLEEYDELGWILKSNGACTNATATATANANFFWPPRLPLVSVTGQEQRKAERGIAKCARTTITLKLKSGKICNSETSPRLRDKIGCSFLCRGARPR